VVYCVISASLESSFRKADFQDWPRYAGPQSAFYKPLPNCGSCDTDFILYTPSGKFLKILMPVFFLQDTQVFHLECSIGKEIKRRRKGMRGGQGRAEEGRREKKEEEKNC
jgi:hypothetical protein